MSTDYSFDFDSIEDWASEMAEADQVGPSSPATVRFDLFLKVRQIKQLELVVQNLKAQRLPERRAWLQANHTLMTDLVNEFTDESLSKLQGVATDPESVKLSVDLISNLRQTLLSLDGLMGDSKRSLNRRSSVRA